MKLELVAKHEPIVQELVDMIKANNWEEKFDTALKNAKQYKIAEMNDINTMNDYFDWLDMQLTWVPFENYVGTIVYEHVCKFYFILDQHPVSELQNAVVPHDKMLPLTPLSAWMVKYVSAFGAFMDTPDSLTPESEKTFYDSPLYNMNEYLRPRGGWKTYNELFARTCKPGTRPVAVVDDSTIITSPADSTFDGQWEIREDSEITIKGFHWKVMELLEGSPYKNRFVGGYF
ncbi:MAG: phosphatidylserine decarboxylase, partial [Bacteroidaceae bacterium]